MRKQDMMASNHGQLFIAHAGSMDTISIAEIGRTPGFVLSEPPVNAISQATRHYLGIICECISCISNEPSTTILQGHRQIPMIERSKGTNASSEQGIDQAVVKIQASFIDSTGALWQDARPGERETIGVQIEFSHERNIFFQMVIMIRRNLTCLAPVCRTG